MFDSLSQVFTAWNICVLSEKGDAKQEAILSAWHPIVDTGTTDIRKCVENHGFEWDSLDYSVTGTLTFNSKEEVLDTLENLCRRKGTPYRRYPYEYFLIMGQSRTWLSMEMCRTDVVQNRNACFNNDRIAIFPQFKGVNAKNTWEMLNKKYGLCAQDCEVLSYNQAVERFSFEVRHCHAETFVVADMSLSGKCRQFVKALGLCERHFSLCEVLDEKITGEDEEKRRKVLAWVRNCNSYGTHPDEDKEGCSNG